MSRVLMTVDRPHQKALCVFVSVVVKHYECIVINYDCLHDSLQKVFPQTNTRTSSYAVLSYGMCANPSKWVIQNEF